MGEVEEKAGAEAEKKGITGKARRDYIGGAFHRIMAHHAGKVKEQKEKRAATAKKTSTLDESKVRKHLDTLPKNETLLHSTGGSFGAGGDKEFRASELAGKLLRQSGYKDVSHVTRKKIYLEDNTEIETPAWVNRLITEAANTSTGKVTREDAERALTPAPAAKTKTQLEYEKFLASKEKSMEEARLYREEQNRLAASRKAREDAQEQGRQEDIARRRAREAEDDRKFAEAHAAERARLEHESTRPRTAEEEKRKRENDAIQAVKDAEARDKKRTKELERAKAYRIKHNISLTTGKKRKP